MWLWYVIKCRTYWTITFGLNFVVAILQILDVVADLVVGDSRCWGGVSSVIVGCVCCVVVVVVTVISGVGITMILGW